VGIDNITFETDYPHTDSTWPDTKKVAEKMMSDLTDEQIYKIVRGNAIRMLDLDLDRGVVPQMLGTARFSTRLSGGSPSGLMKADRGASLTVLATGQSPGAPIE